MKTFASVFAVAVLFTGCTRTDTLGSQDQNLGTVGHPPRSDGTCDTGLTPCASVCTDLQSDDASCGRCGSACGTGQHCLAGSCSSTAVPDMATACDPTACNVACMRTSCPMSGTCSSGACVCEGIPCLDMASSRADLLAGPGDAGTGSDGGPQLAQIIAHGLESPLGIALDGNNVYFTEQGTAPAGYLDGRISKVSLTGGTPTVLAMAQANPTGLAVDATSVYFCATGAIDGRTMKYSGGAIGKVSIAGGAPVTLSAMHENPVAIAVAGASVYWISNGFLVNDPNPADIGLWSVGSDGSGATHLGPGNTAADSRLAVTTDRVYSTNFAGGIVFSTARTGASTMVVASGMMGPDGLAFDASFLYWTDSNSGELYKLALTGGAPVRIAVGPRGAGSLAVDGSAAYWIANDGTSGVSSVLKVDLAGGTPQTLLQGAARLGELAINATSVYVTVGGGPGNGSILRVQK